MWSGAPLAQTPAPAAATPADTAAKIQRLGDALNQARAQLQRTQAEIDQLQAQLQQLQSAIAPTAAPASAPPATLDQRVAAVEDQQAILQGKVDDQYQTKVASDSKFRVTLGGLLLMNLYGNTGTVENSDVPNLAFANPAGSNGGDFGATLRQSEITLRVAGPDLWGAQAGADLTADFFGGFPGSLDGTATGVARLKVARGHLDWTNTSLDFGLDTPLISPLSPTSYASLGTPALGYSGNLWTWTPQVWIEHRWQLGPAWHTALDAGIMDPLSGQFPVRDYVRVPEAGEASREPAFEARQSIGRELFGRDFTLGAGAYTSRQSYNFGRGVRAWAATADWNLAVASWLDLSGEIYRGRAIGGLWGGIGDSILASGA
ncbi:MAG TPA: hypothetical protein VN515_01615, partial [Terriglobales bacterium]|nr:hypothetical protein [Terriglobales bacterium]